MVDREKKLAEGYQEIADGVFISPEEQIERLKWEIECTRKEILQICKEARIIYKEVLDMGEEDDSSEVA
tara:strand:- start:68 stop:274 length:207 start_codon:yes stop_codon:yes gene_type:complete